MVSSLEPGREPRTAIRYRFERGQKQRLFASSSLGSFLDSASYATYDQSVVAADDRSITLEIVPQTSRSVFGGPRTPSDAEPFEVTFSTRGTDWMLEPHPIRGLDPWLQAFGATKLPLAWPKEPVGPGASWQTAYENEGVTFVVSYLLLDLTAERALVATDVSFEFDQAALQERARARREALGQSPAEPNSEQTLEMNQFAVYDVALTRPTVHAVSRTIVSAGPGGPTRPSGPLARLSSEGTSDGGPKAMPAELLRDVLEVGCPEAPYLFYRLGKIRDETTIPLLLERLDTASGDDRIGFQMALTEITGRKQRSPADLEDAARELFAMGERNEAIGLLDRASAKAGPPSNRAAYTLAAARLLRRSGAFSETDARLKQALASDEIDAEALNALAWWRATAPEGRYRVPAEALSLALRLAARGVPNAEYLRTLAAAYAANGEFARAAALQKEALTRAKQRNAFSKGRTERWERYLTSYESGRAVVQKPDKDDVRDSWTLP